MMELFNKLPVEIKELINEYIQEPNLYNFFEIDMTMAKVFVGKELITNYDKKKVKRNIEQNYDLKYFTNKIFNKGGYCLFNYDNKKYYKPIYYNNYEEYYEDRLSRCIDYKNGKYFNFFSKKSEAKNAFIINKIVIDNKGYIIKMNVSIIYIEKTIFYKYLNSPIPIEMDETVYVIDDIEL